MFNTRNLDSEVHIKPRHKCILMWKLVEDSFKVMEALELITAFG